MPEYSSLINPPSAEDVEEQALDLMEAAELPTTSWHATSVPRAILGFLTEVAADLWFAVAQIARGVLFPYSSGAWVDLVLASQYDEARVDPVFTIGQVTLTDNGGGPHTITDGAFVVANEDESLKYRVISGGGVLALNGSRDVVVKAFAVGNAYNLPNGAITKLVTAAPTVTVSNPAIGSTGTWITTLGADLESDAAAMERAPLKWATLSTGSPPSAYLYWALSTIGVTRAKVDDGNPDGANTVRVYIDNGAQVATLQATLQPGDGTGKAPSGTLVTVSAATTEAVTVPAVVTVRRAHRTEAEAAIVANLTAYAASIDIGGIVRKAQLIEEIMSPDGVVDVEIGSAWTGTPNLQLGTTAIPQFTLSLSYVEVS
jgi:uncharacterized phage protein gp47/JayE